MNPGALIMDGQIIVAIAVALCAGLVSFASPCVLPLVPAYLGYVGGMSGDTAHRPEHRGQNHFGRARVVVGAMLFVAGFSAVFVTLSVFAGSIGVFVIQWQDVITRVLGAIVILMGFVFIGAIPLLQRTAKTHWRPRVGLVGAPVLGVTFAVGWTPCFGPALVAISALSLESASVYRGALLGFAYCVGLGIPFILIALGIGWVASATAFLKKRIRAVNVSGGLMLMLLGILMVSGIWTMVMSRLTQSISGFTTPI